MEIRSRWGDSSTVVCDLVPFGGTVHHGIRTPCPGVPTPPSGSRDRTCYGGVSTMDRVVVVYPSHRGDVSVEALHVVPDRNWSFHSRRDRVSPDQNCRNHSGFVGVPSVTSESTRHISVVRMRRGMGIPGSRGHPHMDQITRPLLVDQAENSGVEILHDGVQMVDESKILKALEDATQMIRFTFATAVSPEMKKLAENWLKDHDRKWGQE